MILLQMLLFSALFGDIPRVANKSKTCESELENSQVFRS